MINERPGNRVELLPRMTTLTIRRSMVAKVSMVNLGTATVPAKAELAGQEENQNQKNRTRQKFKKPKRLPYEETEVKSLEIGNLLEKEELKSLEGVSALAEVFVSSESPPIVLDELLPLSLQELKTKVSKLDLEFELPAAPLREEIVDALLDACLEKVVPVKFPESSR